MQPALIITAVSQEAKQLEQALASPSREQTPGFAAVKGLVGNLPVVICVAGVGKINSSAATATLIERYQPRMVINTGCAGAYPGSGLAIGGLAVASAELLGDEGAATSNGWLGLREMNLPYLTKEGQRYYNEIPLSRHASERAMQLADYQGINMLRGRFITVSTCSGSLSRGEEMTQRFGAIAENMEGAAIALVCLRYGIDCLEIRGISNLVEERNLANWDIPLAVGAAQRFVLRYLEALEYPEVRYSSRHGAS